RLPELKRVIAAFGNRIAMEETLEASLERLFGGRPPDAVPVTAAREPAVRPGPANQALQHFQKAQEHLKRWNWPGFGEELRQLEEILKAMERGSPSK
ncbi:MAG: UPF0182 family protein, partial [Dehalococcoidia bacterium]|nr:UPF0182 family protein [Dehalococcoidia bacterium]